MQLKLFSNNRKVLDQMKLRAFKTVVISKLTYALPICDVCPLHSSNESNRIWYVPLDVCSTFFGSREPGQFLRALTFFQCRRLHPNWLSISNHRWWTTPFLRSPPFLGSNQNQNQMVVTFVHVISWIKRWQTLFKSFLHSNPETTSLLLYSLFARSPKSFCSTDTSEMVVFVGRFEL